MGSTGSREKEKIEPEREVKVDTINKRTLGKEIVKLCGHEGTENSPVSPVVANLRKLFQGCITKLEQEKESVWQNAELTIYGMDGKEYKITAGSGKHRFVALLDENDEVQIVKRK